MVQNLPPLPLQKLEESFIAFENIYFNVSAYLSINELYFVKSTTGNYSNTWPSSICSRAFNARSYN